MIPSTDRRARLGPFLPCFVMDSGMGALFTYQGCRLVAPPAEALAPKRWQRVFIKLVKIIFLIIPPIQCVPGSRDGRRPNARPDGRGGSGEVSGGGVSTSCCALILIAECEETLSTPVSKAESMRDSERIFRCTNPLAQSRSTPQSFTLVSAEYGNAAILVVSRNINIDTRAMAPSALSVTKCGAMTNIPCNLQCVQVPAFAAARAF